MNNEMNQMHQLISLDIIQTIIQHSDNVYLLRIALMTKLRDLLSCKLVIFVQFNAFDKDQKLLSIEYSADEMNRSALEEDIAMIRESLVKQFTCTVSENSYQSYSSFSKYTKLLTVPLIQENKMLGTILLFDPSPLYNLKVINDIMEKIQPYISIVLFNAISYSEMENIIYLRTKELNKAILQVNESSKAKSLFLANMSHEMRTPLNGIIGFLELLIKQETDPTKMDYLKKIDFASHTLLHLISEVLDLSRIEFDNFDLYEAEFDLQRTVEDITGFHIPKAHSKGLDFHLQTKGIPSNVVIGDVERFKQILNNLLSNAIKFTSKGSVELIIECEPYQITFEDEVIETRLKFKCDVIDTGKGINEKNLEKIFEIFSQEDQTTTREYGGSGLGLAIAQRLIHLMGGDIHVESVVGTGSVFSFYIMLQYDFVDDLIQKMNDQSVVEHTLQGYTKAAPINENLYSPLHASEVLDSSEELQETTEPLQILVVEDNELNAQLIHEIFKLHDLPVDFALNGQEALHAFNKKYYDLILMDCQMPVMDGLLATKLIRQQQPIGRHPVIIALTAATTELDRVRCIEAGMDDFITKPINMDSIITKINKYSQVLQKKY